MRCEADPIELERVLITEELLQRTSRTPALEAENKALRTLARQLAQSSQTMLDELVILAKDLCQAGTAGVSLLEVTASGEEVFRWVALAGTLNQYQGETTPVNFSPCGVCLERGTPQLYFYPERYFTYFQQAQPAIIEELVIPLLTGGRPLGTIWVVSHDEQRHFDVEDVRLMTSLADFATAALQSSRARQISEDKAIEQKRNEAESRQANAALGVSEACARLAIKVGQLGTWRYDPNTNLVELDERMREIWGEPEDAVTIPLPKVIERIHPDDQERVAAAVGTALNPQSSGTYDMDYRIVWDDGTERWVSANGQAQFEGEGKARHPVGFLGTALDITDRKQAEVALAAQEQRYRHIFEAVSVSIWEEDFSQVKAAIDQLKAAGVEDFHQYFAEHPEFVQQAASKVHLWDVNQAALRMFGAQDKAELLSSLEQIFVPVTQEAFIGELLAIATEAPSFATETVLKTLQGDRFDVWVTITFPPKAEPYDRVLVSLLDISARKQTEAALRNSAERLSVALAASKLGDWSWDATTDLVTFSEQAAKIFGIPPGSHLTWGQIQTLLHEDDREQARLQVEQAIAQHSDYDIEYRVIQPGGSERWVAAKGRAQYEPSEQVIGMLGVVQDITERKRTEEILQRTAELDAFRISLADALRPLTDASEIQAIAARILGESLQATRVIYIEVVADAEEVIVHRNYTNGVAELSGRYSLEDYRRNLTADHQAGRTQIVTNILDNPRYTDAEKARYRELDIAAHIDVPLIKNNQFVALLAVHQSTPRQWTETEVRLVEETAERTWAAVERARAEAALREREQRLSIATAAAQLGIFEWKVPEDITIWENDRQYELFGLTPADGSVSAQEFFENYLHPDDAEALTAKLTEAMQTGSLFQTSYRICRKDDTTRWLEVNGQFELAADGSPVRFVGVNADITDRKQAEAAILQREAQFRQLADAMPQQVWIADAQGNTQYVNQQWTTYTGLTLEQTQNIHYATQVIHPDDFEATGQLWSTALATGLPYQAEFRLKYQADHTYRWFLSRAIAIRDEQGQIVRWFGTSTDIEEFRRAQAEREQLLQQEQTAREAAENANRIKDEFLAMLSHELRSPLNPILGWSTLLLGKKLDEAKTAQALATIQRNAKLQSELIEDLLDVARILRGKLRLNVAGVNLVSIIQAAMETVRLAAEAKSIQVKASLAPDVGLVSGDSMRLQQVIWNLLSNAVKFTPNGGRVNIRLESLDSHAQMTVSDTGQGIDPDFLPYVFDHFRQANAATTRKFGGLGLGLAIVRHLVELHGGTVKAESLGVGMGATFTIRLPLMPLQTIANQNSQSSESAFDLNGIRVLVVDDEPDSREFVAFVLEQAGADVMIATTAHEALITLIQSKPDVILSDIGMPDTDGYMLMQQVRALPPDQGGQVPAIALTAYAGDFNQQQALQAGFQQHVSKPAEPEVLVEAIASLLNHTKR